MFSRNGNFLEMGHLADTQTRSLSKARLKWSTLQVRLTLLQLEASQPSSDLGLSLHLVVPHLYHSPEVKHSHVVAKGHYIPSSRR